MRIRFNCEKRVPNDLHLEKLPLILSLKSIESKTKPAVSPQKKKWGLEKVLLDASMYVRKP